jgi:hypothetical protein
MVDAGEPGAAMRIGTEGAILPDTLSGICTASSWPLWKVDFAKQNPDRACRDLSQAQSGLVEIPPKVKAARIRRPTLQR